jgi:hypothetical protein
MKVNGIRDQERMFGLTDCLLNASAAFSIVVCEICLLIT